MPKVSVIVPVYNVEKYLERCLDSILNQSFKEEIEVIVVNDGSPDNSQKIIDKYQKKYKNVKGYIKENGGLSSARNFGLTKATGEYVSFIDSDDYIDKDLYKSVSSKMNKKYDIIIFDYNVAEGKKITRIKSLFPEDADNVTPQEYLLTQVTSACNKVYKREYLEKMKMKFPEGIIYEDYATIPGLVAGNPKMAYVEKGMYFYEQSEVSIMRNQEYKPKYENLFTATDILYDKLKDYEHQDAVEYLIVMHNLYHGALNFYKYNKFDQIDRMSDSIKERFPNWSKNKYIKKESFKERLLMKLFYKKQYKLIKLIQKIKRRGV